MAAIVKNSIVHARLWHHTSTLNVLDTFAKTYCSPARAGSGKGSGEIKSIGTDMRRGASESEDAMILDKEKSKLKKGKETDNPKLKKKD